MKPEMKLLAKALFLALACVVLCAPPGDARRRELYVMIPKSDNQPYWMRCKLGMELAARELGVKVKFAGPRVADVSRQIEIMEEWIGKRIREGVKGIAISPEEPRAVEAVIRRAVRRDIPVVTFDSDSPGSERYIYVGTANREAGREAGRVTVRALEGRGTVAVLHGSVTALNMRKRLEGFRQVVDEEKGIEVVALEVNRDDGDLAIAQAENILQRYPKLGAIVATSSSGTPAAVAAARAKGRAGRVKIIGFDLDHGNVVSLRRGWLTAVIEQNPRRMGELAMKSLYKLARGERPKQKALDTGVTVVTKDNVDEAAKGL